MAVDFSLLNQGPDPAQAFQVGFQRAREQRRETESRNALASLLTNPEDPQARSALAHIDPNALLQVDNVMEQRAARQQQQKIHLDEATWNATKRRVDAIGQLAMLADDPQKWDAAIDQLVALGYEDVAQYKGRFSPELRQAAIAGAGQANAFLNANKSIPVAVPPGGQVQFFNPRDLSSGGTPPLASTQTNIAHLEPGMVEEGFRYKGGDPALPTSWEPVSAGGAGFGQPGFP